MGIDCARHSTTQMGAMPYHRFKVGQVVALVGGPGMQHIPHSPLVIARLLPLVDGQFQYGVRSEVDGIDRVVREKQDQAGGRGATTVQAGTRRSVGLDTAA